MMLDICFFIPMVKIAHTVSWSLHTFFISSHFIFKIVSSPKLVLKNWCLQNFLILMIYPPMVLGCIFSIALRENLSCALKPCALLRASLKTDFDNTLYLYTACFLFCCSYMANIFARLVFLVFIAWKHEIYALWWLTKDILH